MTDYRNTVSRDRLAEFRRNSNNFEDNANANQHGNYSYQPAVQQYQHQYQQSTFDRHDLQPYYNGHATAYQAPSQPASTFMYSNYNRYENITAQPIPTDSKEKQSSLASTETFFVKVENIKWLVGKINENVTQIESLQTAALSSINGEKAGQVNLQLEQLVHQTSKLNKEAKEHIQALEFSNAKITVNPSDAQMRRTQLQALKRKFIETIQRYQDIERTFEKRQRQRIERQILIVKPEATPHEIENAIDSSDAPHIFAHSLLNSSRLGDSTQVLDEVQTRHRDIKKIEKTILELHQLFLDMQTMVEMQQETVNNIEKTTEHAVHDLEQGNKHVAVAVKTAKITRKRKWCCFVIFIILLAVAGILIWWFVFPKSHSS
ncbi:t-SNARE [Mucor lusitanicus]|uniref:t-SNARE n=2 Tax=Mucor circinelloides f. lusitanicus TaxID=29924 RepID=A0A8H4F3M9_MUCCL|nr:t-SNARE [Mucor lusitanicus]